MILTYFRQCIIELLQSSIYSADVNTWCQVLLDNNMVPYSVWSRYYKYTASHRITCYCNNCGKGDYGTCESERKVSVHFVSAVHLLHI